MGEERELIFAGDSRADQPNTPPHQIAIVTCHECRRGWHDVPGQSIELSSAALERARCDAIELGRVDDGAAEPPKGSRTIPAHIRRAVLARDDHRCAVPGCTSSRFVDVHHVVSLAAGGDNSMTNLITLCDLHHTMHHDGRITIAGTSGALIVTHEDGRPYGTRAPPN